MFTGIIQHQAQVLNINQGAFTLGKPTDRNLHVGQSIAHDGACMSITDLGETRYTFFAMEESFNKTTFGAKKNGDSFNIEHCIAAQSLLDGHIVSGHIDTTAEVTKLVDALDGSRKLQFSYDAARDPYVIPKGSIAINGVSLTVVDVRQGGCSVWLIPLTLAQTNLGRLIVHDRVNIEYDILGKYVVRSLEVLSRSSSSSLS